MNRVRHDVAYTLLYDAEKQQILMVHNINGSWTLPGGGREQDELLADAAVREAKEETGYEVSIGDLIAVNERITETTHDLFFTFHGRVVQAPEVTPKDKSILEVRWVDVAEADRLLTYHPEGISNLLRFPGAAYRVETE